MKKNRLITFLQSGKVTAFPILDYLIKERSNLLRDLVAYVEIAGPRSNSWKNEYSLIRKQLMNFGIEFDIDDTLDYPILSDDPLLVIPLSQEALMQASSKWYRELNMELYQAHQYWTPIASTVRVLSSYNMGRNSQLLRLFEEKSEMNKDLHLIPELVIVSRYIECDTIRKLSNTGLLQDKAKSLLNKLKEALHSQNIIVRSHDPNFQARIYVDKETYSYKSSDSRFRLIDNFVQDIKLFSESHANGKLFIQPYYEGVEYIVNGYVADTSKKHYSIFKSEKVGGEEFLTPRMELDEHILTSILKKLTDLCGLKSFSAKFIKLQDGKFAIINLKHQFNDQLPATLKYQLDIVSYELTRGVMSEPEREKLLLREYYTEYTDKTFKANLIY